MIGRCPHCGIDLTMPPFNDREVNEVMVVMNFRQRVDGDEELESIEKKGYCDICKASLKDLEAQSEE
ncbi:hypothetical protein HOE04_04375 [archaeon]|jgi:hypothetical protein|nr:hypothetical protein [archaeon]